MSSRATLDIASLCTYSHGRCLREYSPTLASALCKFALPALLVVSLQCLKFRLVGNYVGKLGALQTPEGSNARPVSSWEKRNT
jgi:hypothetical protein